jgi:hypothetical protein
LFSLLAYVQRNKLLLFVLVLVLTLAILMRLAPYLINQPYFEIGSDTGIYERLFSSYSSAPNWHASMPAYPQLSEADEGFADMMEPGFFVLVGLTRVFSTVDVHSLFRYYLPSVTAMMFFILVFVVARKLSRSDLGGVAAVFLFAVSNIQYEAVNESYYKQIFGMFALVAALYGMDKLIHDSDSRYFVPTVLLGGSAYFYSRPVAFTFFLFLAVMLIYESLRRNRGVFKELLKVSACSLAVTLPMLLSRFDVEMRFLEAAIYGSITRVSMLGTNGGSLYAGGAVPGVLQGFDNVLVGYMIVFAPVVFLAIAAVYHLRSSGRSSHFVPFGALLAAYVGLWLYFGNRLIYELDLILIVLAGCGMFILARKAAESRNPFKWRKIAAFLVALLVVGAIVLGLAYQTSKQPYITENMDGVHWIESNISTDGTVIFAPDYISSDLLQRGYRAAIWDYYLARDGSDPKEVAEHFILEAPSNASFLTEFLSENPIYAQMKLYVIWGTEDLTNPLPITNETIPFDDYESSDWFELTYEGSSEILSIYLFVGI